MLFLHADVQPLVDIPFTLRGVHVYIEAKINGQGPFPLNIDTGGAMGLTARLAKQLQIRSEGDVVGGGAGGGTVKWGLARNLTVQIGSVDLKPLTGTITNDWNGAEAGIGPELFERYTVSFDYDRRRMRLYPKGAVPNLGAVRPTPLRFLDDTKPLVYVGAGGVGGWFMADIGGGVGLIAQRNFWIPTQFDRKASRVVKTIVGYGIGGPIYGRIGRMPAVTLGGATLRDMLVSFSDMTQGTLANPKRSGLLGQRILRRFNITFDYANSRAFFVPNRAFDDPMSFGRTGLSGLAEGFGLPVDYVIPGSPADKAGIRKGDALITLDGAVVDDGVVRAAFWKPVGTRIRVSVLRKDRVFETTLVLREVL